MAGLRIQAMRAKGTLKSAVAQRVKTGSSQESSLSRPQPSPARLLPPARPNRRPPAPFWSIRLPVNPLVGKHTMAVSKSNIATDVPKPSARTEIARIRTCRTKDTSAGRTTLTGKVVTILP